MIVQVRFILTDGKQLVDITMCLLLELTGFIVAASAPGSYRGYLLNVARLYADDTAVSIRRVLDHAASHGWGQSELRGETARHYEDRRMARQRMARTEMITSRRTVKRWRR